VYGTICGVCWPSGGTYAVFVGFRDVRGGPVVGVSMMYRVKGLTLQLLINRCE